MAIAPSVAMPSRRRADILPPAMAGWHAVLPLNICSWLPEINNCRRKVNSARPCRIHFSFRDIGKSPVPFIIDWIEPETNNDSH
jgi:hypothetical protein